MGGVVRRRTFSYLRRILFPCLFLSDEGWGIVMVEHSESVTGMRTVLDLATATDFCLAGWMG